MSKAQLYTAPPGNKIIILNEEDNVSGFQRIIGRIIQRLDTQAPIIDSIFTLDNNLGNTTSINVDSSYSGDLAIVW